MEPYSLSMKNRYNVEKGAMMTTITLPPDLENRLADEARRRGTTPELLAVDSLRMIFVPQSANGGATGGDNLWSFLSAYIGTISGTTEALSENCGKRFVEGLVAKQNQRHL
jgi:hypothetical protein